MKGVIDRAKKKGKPLTRGKRGALLREAIAATDTRNDAWLVVSMAGEAGEAARAAGAEVKWVGIAVAMASALSVDIRAGVADPAQAEKLVGMVSGQLSQLQGLAGGLGLGAMASSIAVVQDNAMVKLSASMSSAELDKLIGLVRSM
jgi:hypothetical protein